MPNNQSNFNIRGRRRSKPRDYFEKLSSRLKAKFGEILLLIAEEEEAIEDSRQSLAQQQAFEPSQSLLACFTRIDREDKGHVTAEDIVTYLHENSIGGLQLSAFECTYVIKYFDSTFQGHLNFEDFSSVILPCDNLDLRRKVQE